MESTLAIKKADLEAEVGLFLGYGRGEAFGDTAWSAQQEAVIESCVKSGIRQFYFPPPVDNGATYDWSFLTPTVSLSLASDASTLLLPADFGGMEGTMTLSTSGSQVSWPITLTGEGLIRQQFAAAPSATGRPMYAAVEPLKGTSAKKGQRFQLYVWPTADQAYTLRATYYILPNYLTGDQPYCYGGAAHAETILESCLAIAEQRFDDARAVHSAKFMERLHASIGIDRKHKPQNMGRNRDLSDGREYYPRHANNSVTYNGISYAVALASSILWHLAQTGMT
jgi:hypothetical protein